MIDGTDESVKMSSDSIDQRVYSLAITEMYKKGEIEFNKSLKSILDFNIQRAERAELKLNALIDRIEEMAGKK
jgi:hypothetical protein